MSLERPAFPVVIAAPSGAGKTTLARRVVERNENVVFSISATTRPPRPGERDGTDYHFVDKETFEHMVEQNELAEWAVVHGHHYGTPRKELAAAMARGATVVLDIDVQGARQVRKVFPEALLVFVLPPSAEELAARLSGRASEDPAERRRRLAEAQREIRAVGEFDYVVINDDLDRAVERLEGILNAEWGSVDRLRGVNAHVETLANALEALIPAD